MTAIKQYANSHHFHSDFHCLDLEKRKMASKYHSDIDIRLGSVVLKGELCIPPAAESIIIFSHGSGSSRLSPRNKMVADYLNRNDLGTLLFDLLTEQEDRRFANRFNIELLTARLIDTTKWIENFEPARQLSVGYFGASTGAASALKAAARLEDILAVVSRGGRPDLASESLDKVNAPTLLIVGSLDYEVLKLNREAYAQLTCEKRLEVIEGASHLFEEKGTMERVCKVATEWFNTHLQSVKIPINH